MTGKAIVLQGNALALPLPDESVDLIVTSPPYFALRSYQDGGEHYAGQIGSEPTPKDFVDALVTAMREAVRVLKPTGSIFVNLGDKYAGSGGHNNATLQAPRTSEFGTRRREKAKATRRTAPDHYNKSREVAEGVNVARKSLLGLPWRFALACTDELGLILREEIVWSKPNGLPESVRDRCRRTHEQWFHFTKAERYFAAIDEIRAPHAPVTVKRAQPHRATTKTNEDTNTIGPEQMMNPKGALPPSVWTIATEALTLPALAIEDDRGWRMFGRAARTEDDARKVRAELWAYAQRRHAEGCESLHVFEPDHFAAFPTEWPRRLILGFAPSGVCTVCGEGRVPLAIRTAHPHPNGGHQGFHARGDLSGMEDASDRPRVNYTVEVGGYVCACTPYTDHPGEGSNSRERDRGGRSDGLGMPAQWERHPDGTRTPPPHKGDRREYHLEGWDPPPTTPAVVLDPFGGTGTVAMVAKALGHVGISVDLSLDYTRLARWRCEESGHGAKAIARTATERQGVLL